VKRSISTELLVIGAGATGLGIAWDAGLRGVKTLVVDQYGLAQGTSGRYHGLLHSGGRYVVTDPPMAAACAQENRILRQISPHPIEPTGGYFIQTPADPPDYVGAWCAAADRISLPFAEVKAKEVLSKEPNLTVSIARAFETRDASMDSFELLHDLQYSIQLAGGAVLLRTPVQALLREADHVLGARVYSPEDQAVTTIGAQMVINAAGPWAPSIAKMAGLDIPLALGRGTMVAMAARLVQRVINRCRQPSDGDIIVPVGTVCVLGTTDLPVEEPEALTPQPWEIDLLLAEAENLIPSIHAHRPLRVWCGVRPLLGEFDASSATRHMTRAHAIIDHEQVDGVAGLVSVVGGKLTTFRLVAEETMDLVSQKLSFSQGCLTARTPLPTPSEPHFFQLPGRLSALRPSEPIRHAPRILCECELVSREDILEAHRNAPISSLDDLRRDVRLGMGPCQGSFCTLRAASALAEADFPRAALDIYESFAAERWRGIWPLAWGHGLRQIELNRRIMLEILCLHAPAERP
jgi:glycerol-3-phosphate dehydrogenase